MVVQCRRLYQFKTRKVRFCSPARLVMPRLVFCRGDKVPNNPDATETKGLYGLPSVAWSFQQQIGRAGPKGENVRPTRCSKIKSLRARVEDVYSSSEQADIDGRGLLV